MPPIETTKINGFNRCSPGNRHTDKTCQSPASLAQRRADDLGLRNTRHLSRQRVGGAAPTAP